MNTVNSADGTTIAYDRTGSGEPLILVGGAFSYRRYPAQVKLAGLLSARFTVYSYDRRGRGDSGDGGRYEVSREIEDLAAVIGAAGEDAPQQTAREHTARQNTARQNTALQNTALPNTRENSMPEGVKGPAYYFPSIEKKYGKPIGYWIDLINSSPLSKHTALVDWLKADYGVGYGHATALVGHALAQRAAEGGGQQPHDPAAGKDRT